jgi:hypothetical protein
MTTYRPVIEVPWPVDTVDIVGYLIHCGEWTIYEGYVGPH